MRTLHIKVSPHDVALCAAFLFSGKRTLANVNKNLPIVRFRPDGTIHIDTYDEKIRVFIAACLYDDNRSEVWTKGIFSKTFDQPWDNQRREYLRLLSDYRYARQWYLARRGFGKTTLLMSEIIRALCFRLQPFVLFTSNEQSIAEARTETIRNMLMTSAEIREIFGYMRPQPMEGLREVFGAMSWRCVDPITNEPTAAVVAKSEGQAGINGLVLWVNGKMRRPSMIVNDDGENRKEVHNEVLRRQHRKFMNGVLFQCVDTSHQPDAKTGMWDIPYWSSGPWCLRLIDSNKHPDAYIPRLQNLSVQDPDSEVDTSGWMGRSYALAQYDSEKKTFTSNVETLSDAQVEAMYRSMAASGEEEDFWREHMCSNDFSVASVFPKEADLQFYNDDVETLNRADVYRILISDPTRVISRSSCPASILAIAIDVRRAKIYMRRQITKKITAQTYYDTMFELGQQYNCDFYCVEGLKSDDTLRNDLQNNAVKRGLNIEFISLSTITRNIAMDDDQGLDPKTAAKRRRATTFIKLHQPYLPTHPKGHVWYDDSFKNGPLLEQEASYPQNKQWDALDCGGHIQQAMAALELHWDEQLAEGHERFGRYDAEKRRWDEFQRRNAMTIPVWECEGVCV